MDFAVVFPGQGSQSLGMLAELANQHAVVKEVFAEASSVLGYDLWDIIQQGPETRLNETDCTQPAMLTAGVAVWRVLEAQLSTQPLAFAGHSLGEYTALVCAGAMPFADAVDTVRLRGAAMQTAVPLGEGAMAAILGLDDEAIAQVCQQTATELSGRVVEPVNYNAPGQVVIAGHADAVTAAMANAKAAGAKLAKQIPVSVPAHSSLMQPAADKLAERLAKVAIQTPSTPVIHNVDAASHADVEQIRSLLVKQLHAPVRWVASVEALSALGASGFVEAGPGKVLAGLGRRINRSAKHLPVYDNASLAAALSELS